MAKQWQKLNWQDPFLLEQQLTDEQRMVRDSAAHYAQSRLQPRVREAFQKEGTDPAIFREMGEMGLQKWWNLLFVENLPQAAGSGTLRVFRIFCRKLGEIFSSKDTLAQFFQSRYSTLAVV